MEARSRLLQAYDETVTIRQTLRADRASTFSIGTEML